MTKYKVGDKIVFKTGIVAAYHQGLIPETALSAENIEFLKKTHPAEWAYRSHHLKFYGKVTEIKEGEEYYDEMTRILELEKKDIDKSYRLVRFMLSNGKILCVLETSSNLRKANLLEKLVKKFEPDSREVAKQHSTSQSC